MALISLAGGIEEVLVEVEVVVVVKVAVFLVVLRQEKRLSIGLVLIDELGIELYYVIGN